MWQSGEAAGGLSPEGLGGRGRSSGFTTTEGLGLVMLGVGMTVDFVEIARSENKLQTASAKAGAWAGAMAMGELGAEIGSVGGPIGAFVGGAVGSAVGYAGGEAAGNEMYAGLSNWSAIQSPRHPFAGSPASLISRVKQEENSIDDSRETARQRDRAARQWSEDWHDR
jgi:phage tail tape-measure protein